MSIRLPLTGVVEYNDAGNVGAGSVAGGVAIPFTLPQDTDNIVVKFTASVVGAGVSAVLQTSDDGGVTYYDVARSSVVTNATPATAQWITATTVPNTNALGSATAGSLAQGGESGLPILGPYNRVFLVYGAITANTLTRVEVKVNQQSATA